MGRSHKLSFLFDPVQGKHQWIKLLKWENNVHDVPVLIRRFYTRNVRPYCNITLDSPALAMWYGRKRYQYEQSISRAGWLFIIELLVLTDQLFMQFLQETWQFRLCSLVVSREKTCNITHSNLITILFDEKVQLQIMKVIVVWSLVTVSKQQRFIHKLL